MPSQQDSLSTSTVSHEIPQHTALVSTSEQFRGDNRPSQEQQSCWLCSHTQHSARDCLNVCLRRIRNHQKYAATLTDFSLPAASKPITSVQLETSQMFSVSQMGL